MVSVAPPQGILLGMAGTRPVSLPLASANRHGLVAGATGTGKTVTLQVLAEGFARHGVPVLLADVKGDLSGLAAPGQASARLADRIATLGLDDWQPQAWPVTPWDVFARQGVPLRVSLSELGPLLLARLLGLNETQAGVLHVCFRVADDEGLLLLDLADLRALLAWVGSQARELTLRYGNVSAASIGAIQRRLLVLEEQGGASLFGEPALAVDDLLASAGDGRGIIHLLDATELLARAPDLYGCLLFWLLAELYENLPEAGDLAKPRFVLFFDEAHLLFDGAPAALLEKVEQVVRLIRSKGVGVYFVTQHPSDLPAPVLAQLGLKVQHALRVFTPAERKAVKLVAESFRPNPALDTATVVTELATGEALVSVLDEQGRPTPVERTLLCPPVSRIGPVDAATRLALVQSSSLQARYGQAVDRDSAYEVLARRAAAAATAPPGKSAPSRPASVATARGGRSRQGVGEALVKSTVRAIGSQLGRRIVRGILGSLLGRR